MRTKRLALAGGSPCPTRLVLLGLIFVVSAFPHTTARGETSRGMTPRLAALLADPDHPARRSDGRIAVWVYFVDRGLTPSGLEAALTRAEATLPPDVATRRGKVTRDRRLVDQRDLPLNPEYLAQAAATGAELRWQSRWLDAASYSATPEEARALAALPCVRRVDAVRMSLPDRPGSAEAPELPVSAATTSTNTWSLDYGASQSALELIDVPPVHELGFDGSGVKLAMMDTGFHMTHEALDHIPVLAAYDFAGNDSIVDNESGDPADAHAHGTMVISTAAGFSPGNIVGPAYGASVILVRADNTSISSTVEEDWWVAGLEWAEMQGADLVSSSLGFWTWYTAEDLDGDTAPATVAADMAAARGLLVINGAGNQGGTAFDVIVSPADGDSVVAVGATEPSGVIALGSSSGPTYDGRTKPDVAAQGIQVPVADPYNDTGYTISGGTSFSGPFVAGVAALILQRAPFLSPMQVREALRNTADRHDTPDNDYGWGIVDALAAVYYWGPHIDHTALQDSEDIAGPYVVAATVDDAFALDAQSPRLRYRADGGPWQSVPMTPQGGIDYAADIPGLPAETTVDYYLEAADVQGLDARLPFDAPGSLFSFTVHIDTVPPVVTHTPLGTQPLDGWPPAVVAGVTDNLGVADVAMSFSVNGGAEDGPHAMSHGVGDVYGLAFPLGAGSVTAGDVVSYTITATDASAEANTTVLGPYAFDVIAGGGQILVMDDASGGEAATVASWLDGAGYATTVKAATSTVAGDLAGKQVVVLLSGDNDSPVGLASMRLLVQDWVDGGGRLLVEGGETGYAALIYPGHTSFGAVLHASSWIGDESGALVVAAGQASHDLLNRPMAVTPPVNLNFTTEGDQDAVVPGTGAQLVLQNANRGGSAGALVYDDNPIDPAGQVVYFPFALSAIADQGQAQALVVNALAYLLDRGLPTGVSDDPRDGPVSPPPIARLQSIVPNPFNDRAVVRIELAQPGPARLDVYDVQGRLVRRLADGHTAFAAGPHDLSWDGRNETGRAVSSGIYFVRLSAAGIVVSGKLALVR